MTNRQMEVVRAVCRNGQQGAADHLFLSVNTVKNHMNAAFRALHLNGAHRGKVGIVCYCLGRIDGRKEAKERDGRSPYATPGLHSGSTTRGNTERVD